MRVRFVLKGDKSAINVKIWFWNDNSHCDFIISSKIIVI